MTVSTRTVRRELACRPHVGRVPPSPIQRRRRVLELCNALTPAALAFTLRSSA
jgi:hypothetical protein